MAQLYCYDDNESCDKIDLDHGLNYYTAGSVVTGKGKVRYYLFYLLQFGNTIQYRVNAVDMIIVVMM